MTVQGPPLRVLDKDANASCHCRRENSAAIRIYYEDHGSGSAVVLVHGYALNDSYNVDLLGGSRVSDPAWQNSF
jgi:hypothetical protein